MYDLNKSLMAFTMRWLEENTDKKSEKNLDAYAPDIIEMWRITPSKEFSGKTPEQFLSELSDDDLLTQFFSAKEKSGIAYVYADELENRPRLKPYLVEQVRKAENTPYSALMREILREQDCREVLFDYAEWLFDPDIDAEVRAHACEILSESFDLKLCDAIDKRLPFAAQTVKPVLSDFVVYAPPTKNGLALLRELLLSQTDTPLYASYLAKYGDPSAIEDLKGLAETCDYVSFMEIVNAIEALGGQADIKRDFSSDPLYRKIKGF